MPDTPDQPVIVKAGGPYTCKTCTDKNYFGVLVEPGSFPPKCPNCDGRTTPAKEAHE